MITILIYLGSFCVFRPSVIKQVIYTDQHKASAGHVPQNMVKNKPATIREVFQILLTSFIKTDRKDMCAKHWKHNNSKNKRRKKRKCFCKRKWTEKFSFCCLHCKYRKKANNSRCKCCNYCRRYFNCCFINNRAQGYPFDTIVFRHFKMPEYVLDINDPHIHHYANGNCNS